MNRAKYKFILQVIGIDNARKLCAELNSDKISFSGVVHEYNLQQLEQGLHNFEPHHMLMHKGRCCHKTVSRHKKKFVGKND